MKLSDRQQQILSIVQEYQPITGEVIAEKLGVSRSTLRTDLEVLSKLQYLDAKTKVGYVLQERKEHAVYVDPIVKDVMSIAVLINEKESLHSAVVTIFLEDVGSLFVVGEKGLSGIISRKDIVKAMMGGGDLGALPVTMMMTRMPNVVTIDAHARVSEAIQKLITHEIDSMPVVEVVDGTTQVVGRFTKTTATKLFAEWLMR